MSRNKLVECKYNPENGQSVCTIRTPYGKAWGTTFLHDEDRDIESQYLGCSIAHYRAKTEAAHKKAQALRYKYLAAKSIYDSFGDDDPGVGRVTIIMENYRRQYKAARAVYENMRSYDAEFCAKLVSDKREIVAKAELLKRD